MLADVYLWTDNYQGALDATNKVIDSEKFALVDASGSWFNTVYAKGNSTESIFEFQYTTANLPPFYSIFLQRPQFLASTEALEQFYGIDNDDASNKDIRGERASIVPGTNQIYKYVGLTNDVRKALQDSDTHWFVYRYADVLLMKAEALALSQQGQEALDIVSDLRLKREAIDLTAEDVSSDSPDQILDYILRERGREFAFEGKRWYDILRMARRNNYARIDIIIDAALLSAPTDQQQSIKAKLQDPNSHYLPINTFELYTNKALIQNPFYK